VKIFHSLALPLHLAEVGGKSLVTHLAEIAAAAEVEPEMSDKRIVIDSVTSMYEQELALAFESGRQWGKFKPWSAPLRARGWRWRR